MAYKALYRTYRPSTFDEVAGQQHIVKTLKNALEKNKIAHAYLFAGPRGTGKTTMAKIFAKALNCEHGIGCQCNECKNCRSIIDGTHPDVLELDAASNNGVDEIRDIIDKVKYGTILGRYKVYIIDEVHMLSTGAFNALLKTLEEPPEHVIFILATTEPHKILPTILSRCQRYDFTKVSDIDIKGRLKVVLESEHIEYNDQAIDLIISLADGGMRDALSLLDQVLAYSGDKLNVDDILNIFALESIDEKLSLISAVASKDVNEVLTKLSTYISKGTDIKRLTDDLLNILKDLLVYQTSNSLDYLDILDAEQVQLLSNIVNPNATMKMIEIIMDAQKDYKNVASITPLFEITLLKMASVDVTEQAVKPAPKVSVQVEKPISVTKSEPVQIQPTIAQPKPEVKDIPQPIYEEPIPATPGIKNIIYLVEADKGDYFSISNDEMINVMVSCSKSIKKMLLEQWSKIKRFAAHPTLSKAAGLIVDGHPLVASSKILILEVGDGSIAERINKKENQLDIQNIISMVFGKQLFVYAVSRKESVDLQTLFRNKQELNRLPKPDEIKLDYSGD